MGKRWIAGCTWRERHYGDSVYLLRKSKENVVEEGNNKNEAEWTSEQAKCKLCEKAFESRQQQGTATSNLDLGRSHPLGHCSDLFKSTRTQKPFMGILCCVDHAQCPLTCILPWCGCMKQQAQQADRFT